MVVIASFNSVIKALSESSAVLEIGFLKGHDLTNKIMLVFLP